MLYMFKTFVSLLSGHASQFGLFNTRSDEEEVLSAVCLRIQGSWIDTVLVGRE